MSETVLVRRCETYERETLERLIAEGAERLGVHPAGKVFVKPNVVFAGDPHLFGTHAYTHPALVGAALSVLAREPTVERVDVGENCAIGFPTRYCLRHAGYYEEIDRVRPRARCPVELVCIDEDRREVVPVGGIVHDTLRLSRTMARADAKVYLPKLKCHCVSRMTGAVKLNIGICSDDDRAIHHDHLLDDKIVDLLAVGWPDLIVMDAIEVGVGNEAFPEARKLGLVLMGTNPLAVDLVGARLLGLDADDVPYLRRAIARGYRPASLDAVTLVGDASTPADLEAHARRLLPHDDAFTAWQDIHKELARLGAPMRFFWGAHRHGEGERCETGCVMGLKMFLASFERYAGAEAFARAKPAVFVIGRVDHPVDARGEQIFLIGKCARAEIHNAGRTTHIDRCFTTASDLTFGISGRLGMPTPLRDVRMLGGLARDTARSSLGKLWNLRLVQDLAGRARRGRDR